MLEIAKSLGITVREQNLGYFDLYTADELVCSGTAAEVAPIVWVDGRTIGSGKPGPVFRQLAAAFGPLTKKEGYPIHGKPKKAAAKAAAKPVVKKAVKKSAGKPAKKPVKAAAKPKSKAKKR